ncbi:DUF3169 family protein [Oceanivirga salmonicida]|uniref:DUF3169 family protein n=1 Tax=Oceanivirga salmonicida TaxID=1769291 RepID=UPI00082BDF8D|nr:DUF3169 family protein [Oceanivirga salmonicida]
MSKDIKIFIKLILIMFVSGLTGFFSSKINIIDLVLRIEDTIITSSIMIFYSLILSGIFISIILYFIGKKRLIKSIESDDLDEKYLYLGLTLIHCTYLLLLGLFLISIYSIKNYNFNNVRLLHMFPVLAVIILVMLNHLYIKFIKSYNKGKKGEVTDFTFITKWVNSCDEREQQEMYKAGFKTYVLTQNMLIISLVLIGLHTFVTKRGVFSIFILMLILIIENIYYYILTNKK